MAGQRPLLSFRSSIANLASSPCVPQLPPSQAYPATRWSAMFPVISKRSRSTANRAGSLQIASASHALLSFGNFHYRQDDVERRFLAIDALGPDLSSMHLNDLAHNWQSQSCALDITALRRFYMAMAFKYLL